MTRQAADPESTEEARWLTVMWGHATVEAAKRRLTGAVAWAPCWLSTPRFVV